MMIESISSKLYLAAKKVNDLNKSGNVKGFSGNENGYAKIAQIKPGCAIWIHHLKNDQLIIDLLISETAANRYPLETNTALEKFKNFSGDKFKSAEFEHSINQNSKSDRFYIDVTTHTFDQIAVIIDKLSIIF